MTDPLEALRAQFIDRCRADRERLAAPEADDAERAMIIHRLAGAAGAFGYPELSAVAADLDVRIRSGGDVFPAHFEPLNLALSDAIGRDAPDDR